MKTTNKTKYLTFKPIELSHLKKKTKFNSYLAVNSIITCNQQPEGYDNVLFIGHDDVYGDVFKAWNNEESMFTLYFGEKGDEF